MLRGLSSSDDPHGRRLSQMKDLTEDLLLTIFHKLPSKSLGLCMCVNKQWRAIIHNNASFLSSPHKNGKDGMYLIFWIGYENHQLQLLYVDNGELESYKLITVPFKPYIDTRYWCPIPLAICNGVLCLTTGKESGSDDIILWNPIIQKMLTLPRPPNLTPHDCRLIKSLHLGFDFDSLTNDYKILKIITFKKDIPHQAEVFSLRNNSWKDISQIAPSHDSWSRFFHQNLNGAIHVLCGDYTSTADFTSIGYYYTRTDVDTYPRGFTYTIVGFDVNADVFREFKLPKQFDETENIDLDVYKESYMSICCSYRDRGRYLELWLMKDYGDTESWENILKFDCTKLDNLDEYGYNIGVWGLGFCNNGEVLWCRTPARNGACGATLISIDLTDNRAQRIEPKFDRYRFSSKLMHDFERVRYFGSSLLLLDDDNAVDSSITRIIHLPWNDMFDFSECSTLLFDDSVYV